MLDRVNGDRAPIGGRPGVGGLGVTRLQAAAAESAVSRTADARQFCGDLVSDDHIDDPQRHDDDLLGRPIIERAADGVER